MLYQGFVVALPIGTTDAAEEQNVSEEGVAVGFFVQGFLVVGGQGAFTREEQRTVISGEVVVEFRGQTEVDARGGGEGTNLNREEAGVFGLPFDVYKIALGEFLEDAFERRNGNMGKARKIFIAD